MGKFEEYKPAMAMTDSDVLRRSDSFARATMVNGLSPRVFILYRQAFATMFIFPFLYFSRKTEDIFTDLKSFSFNFLWSRFITINQNLYLEGLYFSFIGNGKRRGVTSSLRSPSSYHFSGVNIHILR
uniref:Uncharacterized protein n=1 Tax=Brassica oleracea TaxID=3712 RepID=A0A3P6BP49_BRAOL|nr:unnamed protein product [Brassica oleracea]